MQDERPISFQGTTAANSESEQTHEFEEDGVITGAFVGTQVGQEFALQNHAEIIKNGSQVSLWDALDKDFLAGNGRDYDLPLRIEFTEGDTLRLKSENVNGDGYEYHHNMLIRIDYETSLFERITGALRRLL